MHVPFQDMYISKIHRLLFRAPNRLETRDSAPGHRWQIVSIIIINGVLYACLLKLYDVARKSGRPALLHVCCHHLGCIIILEIEQLSAITTNNSINGRSSRCVMMRGNSHILFC